MKYTALMIVFFIVTVISFVLWYRFPEFEDSLYIRSELLGITLSYACIICVFFIIVIIQAVTQMEMDYFIYYLQVFAYMTTFYLCVDRVIYQNENSGKKSNPLIEARVQKRAEYVEMKRQMKGQMGLTLPSTTATGNNSAGNIDSTLPSPTNTHTNTSTHPNGHMNINNSNNTGNKMQLNTKHVSVGTPIETISITNIESATITTVTIATATATGTTTVANCNNINNNGTIIGNGIEMDSRQLNENQILPHLSEGEIGIDIDKINSGSSGEIIEQIQTPKSQEIENHNQNQNQVENIKDNKNTNEKGNENKEQGETSMVAQNENNSNNKNKKNNSNELRINLTNTTTLSLSSVGMDGNSNTDIVNNNCNSNGNVGSVTETKEKESEKVVVDNASGSIPAAGAGTGQGETTPQVGHSVTLTSPSLKAALANAAKALAARDQFGLTEILSTEEGYNVFMEFLISEFSIENLLFVTEYTQIKDVLNLSDKEKKNLGLTFELDLPDSLPVPDMISELNLDLKGIKRNRERRKRAREKREEELFKFSQSDKENNILDDMNNYDSKKPRKRYSHHKQYSSTQYSYSGKNVSSRQRGKSSHIKSTRTSRATRGQREDFHSSKGKKKNKLNKSSIKTKGKTTIKARTPSVREVGNGGGDVGLSLDTGLDSNDIDFTGNSGAFSAPETDEVNEVNHTQVNQNDNDNHDHNDNHKQNDDQEKQWCEQQSDLNSDVNSDLNMSNDEKDRDDNDDDIEDDIVDDIEDDDDEDSDITKSSQTDSPPLSTKSFRGRLSKSVQSVQSARAHSSHNTPVGGASILNVNRPGSHRSSFGKGGAGGIGSVGIGINGRSSLRYNSRSRSSGRRSNRSTRSTRSNRSGMYANHIGQYNHEPTINVADMELLDVIDMGHGIRPGSGSGSRSPSRSFNSAKTNRNSKSSRGRRDKDKNRERDRNSNSNGNKIAPTGMLYLPGMEGLSNVSGVSGESGASGVSEMSAGEDSSKSNLGLDETGLVLSDSHTRPIGDLTVDDTGKNTNENESNNENENENEKENDNKLSRDNDNEKSDINMRIKTNVNGDDVNVSGNGSGNIHHDNRSSVVFKDDLIEHVEISPKPGAHLLPNLESIDATTSDGESTDSNDSKHSKENWKQDSDNGTSKKRKIPQLDVKAQSEGPGMHVMPRVDSPTDHNERMHNGSNGNAGNVSIEHTNKGLRPLHELPEIPIETFDINDDGDESDESLNSDGSNEDSQIIGKTRSDLQYRSQSLVTDLQNDASTSARITNINIRKGSQLDQLNQDEITSVPTMARIPSIPTIGGIHNMDSLEHDDNGNDTDDIQLRIDDALSNVKRQKSLSFGNDKDGIVGLNAIKRPQSAKFSVTPNSHLQDSNSNHRRNRNENGNGNDSSKHGQRVKMIPHMGARSKTSRDVTFVSVSGRNGRNSRNSRNSRNGRKMNGDKRNSGGRSSVNGSFTPRARSSKTRIKHVKEPKHILGRLSGGAASTSPITSASSVVSDPSSKNVLSLLDIAAHMKISSINIGKNLVTHIRSSSVVQNIGNRNLSSKNHAFSELNSISFRQLCIKLYEKYIKPGQAKLEINISSQARHECMMVFDKKYKDQQKRKHEGKGKGKGKTTTARIGTSASANASQSKLNRMMGDISPTLSDKNDPFSGNLIIAMKTLLPPLEVAATEITHLLRDSLSRFKKTTKFDWLYEDWKNQQIANKRSDKIHKHVRRLSTHFG